MTLPLLIAGGNYQERLKQVPFGPGPDLLVLEPEKTATGINAIRSLEKFLQRKPLRLPFNTAVIARAETLTLPAQQALLKTLEEPPDHSQIILLCPNENQLLPTIISRCLVKKLAGIKPVPTAIQTQAKIYDQLCRTGMSGRFNLIAAYTGNAETARDFVIGQLHYLHHQLQTRPETTNVNLIKALSRALTALKFNVNPKLTLEVLSLNY